MSHHAPNGAGKTLPIRVDERDVVQAGMTFGRWQAAKAPQRIETNMMMVAAGREEGAAFPDPLPQLKP